MEISNAEIRQKGAFFQRSLMRKVRVMRFYISAVTAAVFMLVWTALQFYGLAWVSFAIGAGLSLIGAAAAAARLRPPEAAPTR